VIQIEIEATHATSLQQGIKELKKYIPEL